MALKNNPAFKFFIQEAKKPEPPIVPKKKTSKEEPSRRPSLDKHTEELLFQNFLELEKVKRRGSHLTEIENLEKLEQIQALREQVEEENEEEKSSESIEDEGATDNSQEQQSK